MLLQFIFSILLTFCYSPSILADVLLIPEKSFSEVRYLQDCQKAGYICSQLFTTEKIKTSSTPMFDALIDELDLINDEQRTLLPQTIQKIVRTEMISIEQVEVLAQIIEKALSLSIGTEENKKLIFLQNEFQKLLAKLKMIPESTVTDDIQTVIVFKKSLSLQQFNLNKELFNGYYHLHIHPFKAPARHPDIAEDILIGTCENSKMNPHFQTLIAHQTTRSLFTKDCSFVTSINQSLTETKKFAHEYKNPILLTVLALSAFYLTKNYNIEFK